MKLKGLRSMLGSGNIKYTATYWLLLITFIIIVVIFYYVMLDHYTPYTRTPYVRAYVTQIAPQVEGPVTKIYVKNDSYVENRQPLLEIDYRPYSYKVKQLQAKLVKTRQNAEVSIALYPGKIFKAKVESLDWGVSAGQGTPSGELPLVKNPQNWFKLAQRFPVRLQLTNLDSDYALRIGGSTSVTVDTGGGFILNGLARLWLRIGSYVNYIY